MTAVHELLLEKFLERNEVPHLLLFSGRNSFSMKNAALGFTKKWLQNNATTALSFSNDGHHPDIHIAACEGKLGLHSIASVRAIIEKMAYEPFQASGKVFIIEACERMLPTSANALLKSFEEPHPGTVIILITTKDELLLPTIRSRCLRISFQNEARKEREAGEYEEIADALSLPDSFEALSDRARYFASALDEKKKTLEKEISSFHSASMKEFSPHQRQKLEQEIEGQVSARWAEEVEGLLQAIYELYRDAAAIWFAAPPQCLFSNGSQALTPRPLDKVDEALSFAKLAIERSTPLQNVFESLLYKLHRLH